MIDYHARRHYKANKINSNSDLKFQEINPADQCSCGCKRGKG